MVHGQNRFNALIVIDELDDEPETVLISRFTFPVEILTLQRFVRPQGEREVPRREMPESFDAVAIHGVPALKARFEGGIHGDIATASIAVNAIPTVLSAPPGLHTMLDSRLPSYFGLEQKAIGVGDDPAGGAERPLAVRRQRSHHRDGANSRSSRAGG